MKHTHPILETHASDRDSCLARLKAEVVDGLDTYGQAGLVGTAVHRAMEAAYFALAEHPGVDAHAVAVKAIRACGDLGLTIGSVADALQILEKVFAEDSRLAPRPNDWGGRPELKWALIWNEEADDFVAVDPTNDYQPSVRGTMDLVEWRGNVLRITDYKTERAFRSHEDAWEDWQARLYSFAALRIWPEATRVEFRFAMLRHGYNAKADFVRGDPWEVSTEETLLAIQASRGIAVASNSYPETLGPWCGYCPIRMKCTALAAAVEQGAEVSPEQGLPELARRREALKVVVKDVNEAVEAGFAAAGEVPIPLGDAKGTVLGMKPTEAWDLQDGVTYESALERLRTLGMKPEMEATYFRFVLEHNFPGKVRKVLFELGVPAELHDELVTPIGKTTFTTYRPDKPAPGSEQVATLEDIERMADEAGA